MLTRTPLTVAALISAAFLAGCAGPNVASPAPLAPPPSVSSTAATSAAAAVPQPPRDPFAIRGELRGEPTSLLTTPSPELSLVTLPPASPAVAKEPKECAAFATRRPAKAATCGDRASTLVALDTALTVADPGERDGRLLALESCAGAPVGLLRALRADLAPPVCGESLASNLVSKPPRTMTGAVYATLLGQALAGRLARLGGGAPPMTGGPYDKDHLKEFVKTTLAPWLLAQATAVEDQSRAGAKLTSYGRAIAAIEAGMADLRLVDAARSVPLPEEFKKDAELSEIYSASLEQALEPRKTRGRDAVLVALGDFAAVGALHDPRVSRARQLLGKLYGGRRIDALDALLAPDLPPAREATVEQRLAGRLPSFYAGQLLDPASASDRELVRALLERGLPAPFRQKLVEPGADLRPLVARARFELGRLYWRSFDFDQTVAWTKDAPKPPAAVDDDTLLLALGLSLRGGPANAADMMVRAPLVSLGIGDVAALDAVAAAGGPSSAMAAFDAAVLLEIAAAPDADAAFWIGVARRYRSAGEKLTDERARARAEERARNADAIAASTGTKKQP